MRIRRISARARREWRAALERNGKLEAEVCFVLGLVRPLTLGVGVLTTVLWRFQSCCPPPAQWPGPSLPHRPSSARSFIPQCACVRVRACMRAAACCCVRARVRVCTRQPLALCGQVGALTQRLDLVLNDRSSQQAAAARASKVRNVSF